MTGGRLKTPQDADKESLQAKWISDLGELSLRASDVVTLVDKGRQYYARAHTDPWHSQQVITSALGLKPFFRAKLIFNSFFL